MPLFTGYSADEYARILSISRWIFGGLMLGALGTGLFSLWVSARLVAVQKEESAKMQNYLIAAQNQLRQLSDHHTEVAEALGTLTTPRRITGKQSAALQKSLRGGPRGKVILTYLSVEWDAEEYTRQIAELLITAGFDVTISDHLWVHLDDDGLYFCTRESDEVASQSPAAHLQRCFLAAGVKLAPTVKSPEIWKTIAAPSDATVLVISNRD